jgi:hypothetical protein
MRRRRGEERRDRGGGKEGVRRGIASKKWIVNIG